MRYLMILCLWLICFGCKSQMATLINESFKEKYPDLSNNSILPKLERNRSKTLNCYLNGKKEDEFILIEIERYPNGNFDKMEYLSYFNTFDNYIHTCNQSNEPKINDDFRKKTIQKIVSLVREGNFTAIEDLSHEVENSISDEGIIYITMYRKDNTISVHKINEFLIEEELKTPEGFD